MDKSNKILNIFYLTKQFFRFFDEFFHYNSNENFIKNFPNSDFL